MGNLCKFGDFICVFDTETIPDVDALERTMDKDDIKNCLDADGKINAKKLSELAFLRQSEVSTSSFLPVNFHKIVCISAVLADIHGKFMRVSSIKGDSEEEILSEFLGFIDKHTPRLVSYNGRGFDLPMMMIRAMKYNLSVPKYFNAVDKWCNYKTRYDGAWAMDLLDFISDFKAVSGLKLDTLCASLGLPGKYDIHGDQVLELYYNDEIDKINEYCQSDALNTYWLFLKYELLRGNLNISKYYEYISVMSEYLQNEKADMSYTKPFCECIENELIKFAASSYLPNNKAEKSNETHYEPYNDNL